MAAIARAFCPAGVGNVAVGFDIIGHALDVEINGVALGDQVQARVIDTPEVRIGSMTGLPLDLPTVPQDNTATRAVLAFQQALGLQHGFELDIHKGIPLGSGLAGSAASAVAAVVAANAAIGYPLAHEALYPFALEGECASSGAKHGDNVGPQLMGGLCFANAERVIRLPVPDQIFAVVVHPHFVLETKVARAALQVPYAIGEFVHQSDHLVSFLLSLFRNDLALLRQNLKDVLVEPRRAPLIPGFAAVKAAAIDAGAIGASISGAGPSVFAWFLGTDAASQAGDAMQAAFLAHGLASDVFVAPVNGRGARVLS
jgi:homoserine kinase